MINNDSYESAWKTFRRRRRIFWLTLLCGPLLIFCVFAPLASLLKSEYLFSVPVGLLLTSIVVTYLPYACWRCPRCGHPYFLTFYTSTLLFGKKCIHCGLPKWAQNDPDA